MGGEWLRLPTGIDGFKGEKSVTVNQGFSIFFSILNWEEQHYSIFCQKKTLSYLCFCLVELITVILIQNITL